MVGNTIAAPDGSMVFGRIIASSGASRVAGRSELSLELTDIQVNGTRFPILSNDYSVQGGNALGGTARRTAGGAGLGAVIGAIGGNAGRGAAIGAATGGGASLTHEGRTDQYPQWDVARIPLATASFSTRPVIRVDRNTMQEATKMILSAEPRQTFRSSILFAILLIVLGVLAISLPALASIGVARVLSWLILIEGIIPARVCLQI